MPEEQYIQESTSGATVLRPWIEDIKSKFNTNDESTLQIYFGSSKIYQQVGDKTPQVDRLGDDIGKKLQQALENPTTLKGGIRILADGIKVYQARSGDTLDPQYSLSKSSLEQNIPKEVTSQVRAEQKSAPAWEDIRSLISEEKQDPHSLEDSIFQLLVEQATRINQLEHKVEAMNQNKPLNVNLNKWLGGLQQRAEGALQELRGRAQQVPQGVSQFLGDTKNKIQDNLKRRLADIGGNALNAGTRYLAERFGQDNGNGVKVFKGNNLTIAASEEHSGIYNKDGSSLVKDGQIIASVTSSELNKIAQIPVEARSLKEGEKQVAAKSLKA
ncbi:MAG: hypothetical protein AAF316_10470 [Cyanobacteria bacterium P01_A01_bin.80]